MSAPNPLRAPPGSVYPAMTHSCSCCALIFTQSRVRFSTYGASRRFATIPSSPPRSPPRRARSPCPRHAVTRRARSCPMGARAARGLLPHFERPAAKIAPPERRGRRTPRRRPRPRTVLEELERRFARRVERDNLPIDHDGAPREAIANRRERRKAGQEVLAVSRLHRDLSLGVESS